MTNSSKIVIPARYAATRLPGKPLADLAGMPLIVRTVKQAEKTGLPIIVAYDDPKIAEVLENYAINGVKTRSDHENGTSRIAEVADILAWNDDDIVINIQGDEPLLPPDLVFKLAQNLLEHPDAHMATMATLFAEDDPNNINSVKVVCDKNGYALYFSRAKIPLVRDGGDFPYLRHIGIYAYRVKTLKAYQNMQASPLELAEKLEQLRFLEHSLKISVAITDNPPPAGVDCEEDRIRVAKIFQNLS